VNPTVPPIPNATEFPRRYNDTLQGYPEGQGARYLIDQQGTFVAGPSRGGGTATTLQQTTPYECREWHGWTKLPLPHTFVGPSATELNISADVLPPPSGFAAISFSGQITTGMASRLFKIGAGGDWSFQNQSGSVVKRAGEGWYRLALQVAPTGDYAAFVGADQVATGNLGLPSGWFPVLGASYSGEGPNAEFRNLELELIPTPTSGPQPGPPSPPAPPRPTPKAGSGAQLVTCDQHDPHQLWIFSGEDGGEKGTFRVSSNLTDCLDAMTTIYPAKIVGCTSVPNTDLQFSWSSTTSLIQSVETRPCSVASHGKVCHYCLDAYHGEQVGFFDCKEGDTNQKWAFDASAGGGLITWSAQHSLCVGYY